MFQRGPDGLIVNRLLKKSHISISLPYMQFFRPICEIWPFKVVAAFTNKYVILVL